MAVVAVLYVFANVAYLKVMTVPQIAATDRVGADLATRTIGPIGATFVSLTVLLSIIGAINGCILTGARIPFAQAHDRLFFARFGEVHPRFGTPGFAIVCSGIWTSILVLTGSYETLYSYSILAAWIFYTLSVGAIFVLRRKMPQAFRPYRMWGYPYTLWLFVAASIWFMLDALVTQPLPSLMAFVIVASGIVAAGRRERRDRPLRLPRGAAGMGISSNVPIPRALSNKSLRQSLTSRRVQSMNSQVSAAVRNRAARK